MVVLTKKLETQNQNVFKPQTRVIWGFEQLTNTIDWRPMEVQSGAK